MSPAALNNNSSETDSLANPANIDTSDLPDITTNNNDDNNNNTIQRHVLQAEEELRLEIPFTGTKMDSTCYIILQKGSCELWGIELALSKLYKIDGGIKIALYTWHGCVIDVCCTSNIDISYTSDETTSNVAYVNTHAQLEALRDEAVMANTIGPRVLIVGPTESGKTSLAKVLVAYATKLGRTPIWVDLDPADNSISVPGTLAAVPMNGDTTNVETYATGGIPIGTSPLVLFHGSTTLQSELFKAQVSSLASKLQQRFANGAANNNNNNDTEDEKKSSAASSSSASIGINNNPSVNERSSGIIVNTNGWIQDDGFQLLLHTVKALDINIILIMGHDRLYSMMSNHLKKNASTNDVDDGTATTTTTTPKVIKLPRSGGTVSREAIFLRQARSRSIKRYFYGDMIDPANTAASTGSGGGTSSTTNAASSISAAMAASTATPRVPQLTPFLNQISFNTITLYKLSSMGLSASLLPVGATQSTDAIQVQQVELSESLQHAVLAVCHPLAVAAYEKSGRARDLYESGVAGFCAVERIIMDTDTVHLLCPCAGSLPSQTLLLGDITWMD